jgi:hypothetical protein
MRKRYDTPMTPYRRILSDDNIPTDMKESFGDNDQSLNLAELKRGMAKLSGKLVKMAIYG